MGQDYTFLLDRLIKEVRGRNLGSVRETALATQEHFKAVAIRSHLNRNLSSIDRTWLGMAIENPAASKEELAIELLYRTEGQRGKKSGPLSAEEKLQLEHLEGEIDKAFQAEFQIGRYLAMIQALGLWRQGHTCFKAYTRARWGMDALRGHRYIHAYKFWEAVDRDLRPAFMRSIQRLASAKMARDDRLRIWKSIVNRHGRAPAQTTVEEIVKEWRDRCIQGVVFIRPELNPGTIVTVTGGVKGSGFAPKGYWGRIEDPPMDAPNAQPEKIYLRICNKFSWISPTKLIAAKNFKISSKNVERIFRLSEHTDPYARSLAPSFHSIQELEQVQLDILDRYVPNKLAAV